MLDSQFTPEEIREMIYGLDTLVELENGRKVPAINLDNAATTPPFKDVLCEIQAQMCRYGSIGRGTGQKSAYSGRIYEEGRRKVKEFVGLDADNREYTVVYTNNTTDGLNKLASALLSEHNSNCEGFTVISTRMEHHANDLPWRERVGVERVFFAEVDEKGRLRIEDLKRLLHKNRDVKYVAVTAASNVTGYVNDVHRIAKIVHAYGAKIIVDGAQIAAHREFNMLGKTHDENIDFFVFSAHKIYSPFGGGAIIGLTDILDKHIPRFYGGGMVDAVYDCNVDFTIPPELYEAGSPNYPGVVGMLKAMETLKDIGFDYIEEHEQKLMKKTIDALRKIPSVKLYGDNDNYSDRVGIVVFNIGRLSDTDVAESLAGESAISVRHRKFCAHPYVRRLLKRDCLHDGMVRVSFGIYTDDNDVDTLIEAVRKIAQRDIGFGDGSAQTKMLGKRGLKVPNDRG